MAFALRLAEEGVLLGLVVGDGPQVGAQRDVGAVGDDEGKQAELVAEAVVDLDQGVGGDVDAGPLTARLFRGDAGGGAAAEGVKDHVVLVSGSGWQYRHNGGRCCPSA